MMMAKKQQAAPKAEPQPAPTTMAKAPEAAKPEAAKPPAQQPATKRSKTVAKLKTAWLEKGIKLDKLAEKQDGKFVILQPTPEWPVIRVGASGGIELPTIRSYARAMDAAVNGLELLKKQTERDQKKTAPPPPPVAGTAQPQPAPAAKPETPTPRKQKANAAIEARLEARP